MGIKTKPSQLPADIRPSMAVMTVKPINSRGDSGEKKPETRIGLEDLGEGDKDMVSDDW